MNSRSVHRTEESHDIKKKGNTKEKGKEKENEIKGLRKKEEKAAKPSKKEERSSRLKVTKDKKETEETQKIFSELISKRRKIPEKDKKSTFNLKEKRKKINSSSEEEEIELKSKSLKSTKFIRELVIQEENKKSSRKEKGELKSKSKKREKAKSIKKKNKGIIINKSSEKNPERIEDKKGRTKAKKLIEEKIDNEIDLIDKSLSEENQIDKNSNLKNIKTRKGMLRGRKQIDNQVISQVVEEMVKESSLIQDGSKVENSEEEEEKESKEEAEEENEEDSEDEVESRLIAKTSIKKRNKKLIQKEIRRTKSVSKKIPKVINKSKQKIPKFVKGKFNPNITVVMIDIEKEDQSSNLLSDCCIGCNNRDPIRACITSNMKLLNEVIKNSKRVSSIFDTFSCENKCNSLYYALKNNNIKAASELLDLILEKKKKERAEFPSYLINSLDTGNVSEKAFGFRARKVNIGRGNREGNNAFLQKNYNPNLGTNEVIRKLLSRKEFEFDTYKTIINRYPVIEESLARNFDKVVLSGNRKLAAEILKPIYKLSNYGFSELHFKVLNSKGEKLGEFHKASAHKKAFSCNGLTPLQLACINPDIQYISTLIEGQENLINSTDVRLRKPIHYAAVCEKATILEFILGKGGNLNDLDITKKSALMYAAKAGEFENVKFIIEKAPLTIALKSKKGMTAFHYACKRGHTEIVKFLVINLGKKKNILGGRNRMPGLSFASAYDHLETVQALVELGSNVNARDKLKRTPLIMAVRNGNAKVASYLLSKGALFNEGDSSNNTPLHYASAYGWPQCVDILIQAGANINLNNSWGISPVNIAMLKNHYGMLKKLLDIPGADPNCKDEQGRTLVSLCMDLTDETNLDFLDFLISFKKANPNLADINGDTPLHYICRKKVNIIRGQKTKNSLMAIPAAPLINFGNTLGPENSNTNLETLEEYNQRKQKIIIYKKEIISKLISLGADIMQKNVKNETAFDCCLQSNNLELLTLISNGISFNNNPFLLFSFSNKIFNPFVYNLFMEISNRSSHSNSDFNILDDEGYSPILKYLTDFKPELQRIYPLIKNYLIHLIKINHNKNTEKKASDLIIEYKDYSDEFEKENFEDQITLNSDIIKEIEERVREELEKGFLYPLINVIQRIILLGGDPNKKVDMKKKFRENKKNSNEQECKHVQISTAFNLPYKQVPIKKGSIEKKTKEKKYCEKGKSNLFHLGIICPYRKLIQFLLEIQVPIEEKNKLGETPFQYYMKNDVENYFGFMNFEEVFSLFLKYKININTEDKFGNSPLINSVLSKDLRKIELLIENNCDVNHYNKKGEFPLLCAIKQKDSNITEKLLKAKCNVDQVDFKKRTSLHYSVNLSDPSEWFLKSTDNVLMEYGANVNSIDDRGRSPLHYAFVKMGKFNNFSQLDPIEIVSNLCNDSRINIKLADLWGKTPLHYAAQRGATISSTFLINRGSPIDSTDKYGNTPLAISIIYGHPDYAIMLLDKNANVSTLAYPEYYEVDENLEKLIAKQKIRNNANESSLLDENSDSDIDVPILSAEEIAEFAGTIVENKELKKMSDEPDPTKNRKIIKKGVQNPSKVEQIESIFKTVVRVGSWQGLIYSMLEKKYDIALAMQDAILEKKFQMALKFSYKISKNIINITNHQGQNLMHALAQTSSFASLNELDLLYNKIISFGIDIHQKDKLGRMPIHYAASKGDKRIVDLLIKDKARLNELDNEGYSPLCFAIYGDMKECNTNILETLLNNGSNPNIKYKEFYYPFLEAINKNILDEEERNEYISNNLYITTPLIHVVRMLLRDPKNSKIKSCFYSLINSKSRCDIVDSEGKDAFMYTIISNNFDLFEHLLNFGSNINKSSIDNHGKTSFHYAIFQREFGYFENIPLIEKMITNGFNYTIKDIEGLTALDYVIMSNSQEFVNIFEKHKITLPSFDISNVLKIPERQFMEVDYEKDSEKYLLEEEQKDLKISEKKDLQKKNRRIFDVGPEEREIFEVVSDNSNQFYDTLLTKVNIRNGFWGEYLFYKMQILYNKVRNIYILSTRWGRIGEVGANQKTPFQTLEECEKEFKKIFRSKSGNDWSNLSNFIKMPNRYRLVEIEHKQIQYKNFLQKLEIKKAIVKSNLPRPLLKLMKLISNVTIYEKSAQNYRINSEILPIQKLNKSKLNEALKILNELNGIVKNLENERNKGSKSTKEAYTELYSKIYKLSNDFYEIVPIQSNFDALPEPLSTSFLINDYLGLVNNLLNIETAGKILLGSLFNQKIINPLDYCFNSMKSVIQGIEKSSNEYEMLSQYIKNSNLNEELINIYKIERKEDYENSNNFLKFSNRILLFHGTQIANLMGIICHGLKIAPPNVRISGNLFGKGIYFSDVCQKALSYSISNISFGNNQREKGKIILLCEVALGRNKIVDKVDQYDSISDIDSIKYYGAQGPSENKIMKLSSGAVIPIGEIINYPKNDAVFGRWGYNEYVCFNDKLVRIRYIAVFGPKIEKSKSEIKYTLI